MAGGWAGWGMGLTGSHWSPAGCQQAVSEEVLSSVCVLCSLLWLQGWVRVPEAAVLQRGHHSAQLRRGREEQGWGHHSLGSWQGEWPCPCPCPPGCHFSFNSCPLCVMTLKICGFEAFWGGDIPHFWKSCGYLFCFFHFPLSTVMMSDISVMPACASQISLASWQRDCAVSLCSDTGVFVGFFFHF